MKIRMKGNTLRLRLTKSEVEEVRGRSYYRDQTWLGNKALIYGLRGVEDRDHIGVDFKGSEITVDVPRSMLLQWANSDAVSLKAQHAGPRATLSILIEKDFACLKPREDEDESDAYKNPNQHS